MDLPVFDFLVAASSEPLLTRIDTAITTRIRGHGLEAEGILRLVLAAVLGGLVGLEREIRGHEAGLRTFMLVAAGAALAMIVSRSVANWDGSIPTDDNVRVTIDPGRIAYGVMTGVGFLGAGTIIQRRSRVHGLTTAAGIWSVAALGLAAGQGLYALSMTATLLMLITLFLLSLIQSRLPTRHQRRLMIEVPYVPASIDKVRQLLHEMEISERRISMKHDGKGDRLLLDVTVRFFSMTKFARLRDALMTHDDWRLRRIIS